MKKLSMILLVCMSVFLFAVPAFAHVTVQPSTSTPGAWETYTMKVPAEKEEATTKVVLKIPAGVKFSSYEPISGWKTTVEENDNGKVTIITWEAIGEGILAGQFQRFSFVAANQEQDGEIVWDAYQYYADGSIVEWTGDENADNPHSITKITKAANTTSNAAHDHQEAANQAVENKESNGMDTIVLIVSIVAIVVSIAAIIISLQRRK